MGHMTTWVIVLCSTALIKTGNTDITWFGKSKQYICHCDTNQCDNQGRCLRGGVCTSPWFGPGCQDYDVVAGSDAPEWLKGGSDETCNPNPAEQDVTFKVDVEFTWARVVTKDSRSLDNIELRFDGNKECKSMKTFVMSERVMDIHCSQFATVISVTVSGKGVSDLCSLYISAGRNIALKQTAMQTSTMSGDERMYGPQNAVDGETGQYVGPSMCSVTALEHDTMPTWTLKFRTDFSYFINRLVLYNRLDREKFENMENFKILFINAQNKIVFTYQHKGDLKRSTVRVFLPLSIHKIKIVATKKDPEWGYPSLQICEVAIYGEIVCPTGTFGRDCEHKCLCEKKECFSGTGGCPQGCPFGYHFEGCARMCPRDYYGRDCRSQCSSGCVNNSCDQGNGHCQCNKSFWGYLCEKKCPENCIDLSCNDTTGKCHCKAGLGGSECSEKCADDRYGIDCSGTCPEHCVGRCHEVNGKCIYGCLLGWKGSKCDKACEAKESCSNVNTSPSVNNVTPVNNVTDTDNLNNLTSVNNVTPVNNVTAVTNVACPKNCLEGACTNNAKACTRGCVDGFKGLMCEEQDIDCPNGWFGPTCYSRCPPNCLKKTCGKNTGICLKCQDGYVGESCKKDNVTEPSKGASQEETLPHIARAVIIGLILFLFALSLALLICRALRMKSPSVHVPVEEGIVRRMVFQPIITQNETTTETTTETTFSTTKSSEL